MYTTVPFWINRVPHNLSVGKELELDFRFQHVHPLVKCTVELMEDGGLLVKLAEPMRSITPGQYAVFYDGDICLGSAQILNNGPSMYELQQREPISTGVFT